jgi:drug/metabolite transporter (DMT)-like permease
MSIRLPLVLTAPRLAPITRAALWILLSGFCSVMMNVLIRVAAQSMHPFEVAFFRCLFGLVFLLPWLVKSGPALLSSPRIGFYPLRAVIGLISMATWFYGITVVPLATATAVNFTAPLFATLAAVLILHEKVRFRRWSAVVLGFVGVLVIMRPGSERIDANLLILLVSSATAAMNNITVKFLARTDRPSTIVAMFMIYLTPLSLIPALLVWQWPHPSTFGALAGLGALGTIAHISVARALAAADASACAPFEFARLPVAALIGFLWFGEVTDLWTWIGAAIIAGSSIYVAHREAQLSRLNRAALAARAMAPHPEEPPELSPQPAKPEAGVTNPLGELRQRSG